MPAQNRDFFRQGVHYVRRTIRFDNVAAASGVEMHAAMPDGCFHLRTTVQIVTAFNAGTTNDLVVGTAAVPNAYVTTGQAVAGTAGVKQIPGTGRVSGDQTPVIKFTQSGTAATAGEVDVVMEFTR